MMPDLKFYLSLFLRRFHYFLAVALAVTSVGVTLAYTLPPVYRAEARLLVESAQIPDDLAVSTVRVETPEMLQVIQQRLLTRANLLDISRKFGIHADRPEMTADDIVNDMRARTTLRLPGTYDSSSVVAVSFDAPNGQQSAEVTNEFVSQILQQNVELRTEVASQTLEFFEQEVTRLNEDLARQGARILEFKLKNKDALPESLEYRRTRQSAQQERLLQVDRELASLNDRRTRLTELFSRTGQIGGSVAAQTPEQEQLQTLRAELASALVVYSPQNPRIKALQGQVTALEKVVSAQLGGGEGGAVLSTFDLQMADIDGQIAYLAEQKSGIEAELAALNASIEATPGNAIDLGTLERDYENLRVQYNQAVASRANAQIGDRIEVTARGQRIAVIEQAVVPLEPTSPNRPRIAALGALGGIGAGLGLVVLLELLNGSIRRPVDIQSRLGITPFAVIPYIRTRRQILWRRSIIVGVLLFVAVAVPLGLYLLHVYYLPMDLLIEKVFDKLGLDTFGDRF